MPYPRAYLVLLALLGLVGLGFWPGYLSRLGSHSVWIHLHGATATVWVLLLVVQSWAIHHRRVALHRLAGRFSLVLFPLFVAGGLTVLHSMAVRTLEDDLFMASYGPGLGAIDVLALATFCWLYFTALHRRREVQIHARCMLATPILLLMPVLSRVFNSYVPGLQISGPEQFGLFVWSVYLSNLVALGVALALYATAPRHGRMFLVVAAVTVAQSLAFALLGPGSWWAELYVVLGRFSPMVLALIGILAGTALAGYAWLRPRSRLGPAPDMASG